MRIAMISGASRGVGAAIAQRLLDDGWAVSLGLRDVSTAVQFEPQERVLAAHFDANEPPTAAAWVEATVAHYGRIDALINNAAILRMLTLEEGDESELDELWAVNVKAPLRLIRAALPHLRKTGQGRVINMASTDAKRVRPGAPLGYVMTKHALHAMTQAVRLEAHADGVRATAICPGAIDTEMIANLDGATPKADRLQPDTVANMVAFILSLPNQAHVAEFIANTRLESTL
ncbi:MAG: NAD(P)-dependent dehydrogenase (short-subunit alcohol dehydrogenase family) [Glaciecola sp.]|jgi:NAD(P)-dependent dehydrogenase (short-subunit alcohol dehydrogenase family)|uniref:SDR family NAD(P)-dependent oxidoreductase n=1 Tax=Congregibacter sp. TaxID=2744308 RepID=UPI0039E4394E